MRPTIRYDRRGYGRARGMATGGLVRQVDDLIAIASRRSGGALRAQLRRADRAGRGRYRGGWTCEAWPSTRSRRRGWTSGRVGDLPGSHGRPITDEEAGDVAERFLRGMIGDERWDRLPARTRAERRAEGRALLSDVDPSVAVAVPFETGRIEVPCVIGCGTVSPHWYDHAAVWLAARLPNGEQRRLPGAAHGAPLDDPERRGRPDPARRRGIGTPRSTTAAHHSDRAQLQARHHFTLATT